MTKLLSTVGIGSLKPLPLTSSIVLSICVSNNHWSYTFGACGIKVSGSYLIHDTTNGFHDRVCGLAYTIPHLDTVAGEA